MADAMDRPVGQQSEQVAELYAALAKAQGQFRPAAKDSENPHFRSRYADLASVWEACRAPLAANGLSVMQRPSTAPDGVWLETRLCHASGQWVADAAWWPVAQRTPQAYGSAITYARRYALAALLGIAADDDDDGDAASRPAISQRVMQKIAPPVPLSDDEVLASLRERLAAATSKAQVRSLAVVVGQQSKAVKDAIRAEFMAAEKAIAAKEMEAEQREILAAEAAAAKVAP